MADLFESSLNRIAGMLGAKSGKQLGEENKAATAKKAAEAKAIAEKSDRSAATVFQQRQQLQDDVMTELRRQTERK